MIRKFPYGISIILASTLTLFGASAQEDLCNKKGDEYLFAGGECIKYYVADGEKEGIVTLVVHGNWPEGSNTLARYSPFVDNLAMATDVKTVAIALPGYSGSSTNTVSPLWMGKEKPLAATKEYNKFLADLVTKIKKRFEAKTITYVGHSAGAMMGATLLGTNHGLIENIALAGGRYDPTEVTKEKGLLSATQLSGKINAKTNIVVTYGTKDTVSPPKVSLDYFALLKKKGLNVTLVEVEGADHLDLDMTDRSVEAITSMIESSTK